MVALTGIMQTTESSQTERASAHGRPGGGAGGAFARAWASVRRVALLTVVVTTATLGALEAASAANGPVGGGLSQQASLSLPAAPSSMPFEGSAPFEDSESVPDPSAPVEGGEESPESTDSETPFVDGHAPAAPATLDAPVALVVSSRSLHALALMSQFHPDGRERPPRA